MLARMVVVVEAVLRGRVWMVKSVCTVKNVFWSDERERGREGDFLT